MQKIIFSSVLLFHFAFTFAQQGNPDLLFGDKGIIKADLGAHYNNGSATRQALIGQGGGLYIIFDGTFISKRFNDGSIDKSYGIDGYSRALPIYDAFAAQQADGKIVITGSQTDGALFVARLTINGFPDSSFGVNGIQKTMWNGNSYSTSLAIQNDNKIVIAGNLLNNAGDSYFAVERYNTDGSIDKTFNGTGNVTTNFNFKSTASLPLEQDIANAVITQPDGKIIAAGYANTGTSNDFAIARYTANGSLDTTFDNDGLQTTDIKSFDDIGYSLALQADGKIILAGYASDGSTNDFAVVRYNTNGSIDNSFSSDGTQTANAGSDAILPNSVAIQNDGKILVAGYTLNAGNNDFAVARFNVTGSLDKNFGYFGIATTDINASDDYAGSIALQSDGKILVAGYAYNYFPGMAVQNFALARYNANGSPDNTFNGTGKLLGDFNHSYTQLNTTAIQTDGKIVTAGLTWNGSNYDFVVARYTGNGKPDSSFNNVGKQLTDFDSLDDYAYSLVIQNDGKIVVAGSSNNRFALARYNTDGSPDNTFNGNGKRVYPVGFADVCRSVALQPDGKIIVAGYSFADHNYDSSFFAVVRFNDDGSPDAGFGSNGKQLTDFGAAADFANSVKVQKDGKIVVSGYSYIDNNDYFSIARYNTDGTLDTTFSHDGTQKNLFGTDDYFGESLAIQNDGKIVVAGYIETPSGDYSSFALARYETDGSLDNTFGQQGFQTTRVGEQLQFGISVSINADGKIAVGGTNNDFTIVLYKQDGTPDSTFANNGVLVAPVGIEGSVINNLTFYGDKLYATGYAQFPGTLGVITRYTIGAGSPLPVSLLGFTAYVQNKSVILKWEIATQKNLSNFSVERSKDGNIFTPIGNVPFVQINNGFVKNYSLTDGQPYKGINFYRLKMIDVDGKFSYSNVVAVKINGNNQLRIFPNPVNSILFAQAEGNENALAIIVDAAGRNLQTLKILLNGPTSFSINVSRLPRGLYSLVLYKGNKTELQKFIKK